MRQGSAECMKRATGTPRVVQPAIGGRAQIAAAIAIDQHPDFGAAPVRRDQRRDEFWPTSSARKM